MLVFLDSKGAVTATAPSATGRNSAAMSTIYIVAPISGAVMSLSFRLPNGDEVNPDLADAVHNAVEILKGVDLPAGVHVWSYAIPASVTRVAGTVMYTVTTTFEGGGISTGSGTFVVAPATTKTLPSSAPGVDVWHEILAELARIYAEMETVLGNSPVKGLDGLTTTVTALISKIASLIGNEPIESPLGGATTISTLLGWLKDESVRFSAVIGGGSISFAGSLIEAVNTLREISVGKTSDPSRVYATASDGSPAFLPYAETPTAYSVPQRDGAGRVKTASPASASDAVDFGTFSADKERVGKLITDLQTAVNRLSRAFAFDNWEAALVELTKPALAEAKEKYKIGDAILIRDTEAPDGWVSGYAVSPKPYPGGNNVQNPFDGTDAFTVGWLIISPLEAPKLSLDGYATTDDLNEYGEKVDTAIADAKEYVDKVVNSFDPPSADKVERLAAEVANLTARIAPEYFTTDSSVAYVKTVPDAALPFAEVKEVGGMTYAEGGTLQNAAVTALKTVGYNALDLTPALNECLVYNGDGTYTLRKTSRERFSAKIPFYLQEGQLMYSYIEVVGTNRNGSKNINVQRLDKHGSIQAGNSVVLANGGGACQAQVESWFIRLFSDAEEDVGTYITFKNPMICLIDNAQTKFPYSPYVKRTYPIPAEVQALEGWGLGVNETYHNRLLWAEKKYRQEVARYVFTGDNLTNWEDSNRNFVGLYLDNVIPYLSDTGNDIRAVCNDFTVYARVPIAGERGIGLRQTGGINRLYIRDDSFSSAADFKAYFAEKYASGNPVIIDYVLASPIVTDLPDLPDDNFIEVEGGGTVTAVNEGSLAAPTKIEYQLKEATA